MTAQLHTISWYDGVVEALLFGDDKCWRYSCLVAWKIQSNTRYFCTIETTSEAASRIINSLQAKPDPQSWSTTRRAVERAISSAVGKATLARKEHLQGPSLEARTLEVSQVQHFMGKDIEWAFDESVLRKIEALLA